MPPIVVGTSLIGCKFAVPPLPGMPLVVEPEGAIVTATELPVATIADCIPVANIPPFGVCVSLTNPATKNPTGEAPCVPAIDEPWAPGSVVVKVNGIPALTADSVCGCSLGTPGCISVITSMNEVVQANG